MLESTKRITDFRFRMIEIDSTVYTDDVIIHGSEVIGRWFRKEGHCVDIEDFACVPLESVAHLVIGTGCYGMMKISPSLEEYCRNHSITLESMRTPEAVNRFNACCDEENLLGAFHLSC